MSVSLFPEIAVSVIAPDVARVLGLEDNVRVRVPAPPPEAQINTLKSSKVLLTGSDPSRNVILVKPIEVGAITLLLASVTLGPVIAHVFENAFCISAFDSTLTVSSVVATQLFSLEPLSTGTIGTVIKF